jgi:DNA-binding CsgD family transcriptional regulator
MIKETHPMAETAIQNTGARLGQADRLALNEADVAAKVMDGEAIVMNLANGYYYSLTGTGAFVLEWLSGGHSLAETAEALTRRYAVSESAALADVVSLATRLLDEGLMQARGDAPVEAVAPPSDRSEEAYETPVLESFADMADLLALDPPMPGLARTPWQDPADDA